MGRYAAAAKGSCGQEYVGEADGLFCRTVEVPSGVSGKPVCELLPAWLGFSPGEVFAGIAECVEVD